jgi:FxsC-like protein
LPPLPQLPPIDEVGDAFRRRGPGPVKPLAGSCNTGPRFVQFVFVAGRRDELGSVRERLDPYGDDGGYDWYPYLPEVKERVGITSMSVACMEKLMFEFVPFNDDIIVNIKKAERENKIVAILVDTWTLRLPRYRTLMNEYDGQRLPNCAVLVCWNSRDEELTEAEREELKAKLSTSFVNHIVEPNPNIFLEIDSHEELVKELPALLNKAHRRISEKAEVMRKAGSGFTISKPTINAVRGASA